MGSMSLMLCVLWSVESLVVSELCHYFRILVWFQVVVPRDLA